MDADEPATESSSIASQEVERPSRPNRMRRAGADHGRTTRQMDICTTPWSARATALPADFEATDRGERPFYSAVQALCPGDVIVIVWVIMGTTCCTSRVGAGCSGASSPVRPGDAVGVSASEPEPARARGSRRAACGEGSTAGIRELQLRVAEARLTGQSGAGGVCVLSWIWRGEWECVTKGE